MIFTHVGTSMRRRILHWLVWRFGADLVIAQNITIDNGTIVLPVHRPHGIIRYVTIKHSDIAIAGNTFES